MTNLKRALSGLALLYALTAVGCTRQEQPVSPSARLEPPPNIVLIVVDTLRADHVGAYGYSRDTTPNIDAWFKDGVRFNAAYATQPSTPVSVASFLTGMLPQEHEVRLFFQKLAPEVKTVADYLGAGGYQTAAVVSNMVLTSEAMALDTRFDYYDDFVDQSVAHDNLFERSADRTTDAALTWLQGDRDRNRPSFLWVHYIDPHGPYHAPDDKPKTFTHTKKIELDLDRVRKIYREPGVTDAADYIDRYDEEIAYADREIGRLLEWFEDEGWTENTVFVFVSDHGESMTEHELWFRHNYHVYDELVRVPLMVRAPGQGWTHRVVEHPVSVADIAPTLLAAAGLKTPEGLYGEDLAQARPGRLIHMESMEAGEGGGWRAVRRDHEKWMKRVERRHTFVSKVVRKVFHRNLVVETERRHFDLSADPRELEPLDWDGAGDVGERFQALIDADRHVLGPQRSFVTGTLGKRIEAPKVASNVDLETLNKLRALGYVN